MDFLSPKKSFDDINKFEASCGILFLTVAAVSYIYVNSPEIPLWVIITIAVIGLFLISWGLYHWHKRQESLDEKLELEIKLLKEKLKDATKAQIKEKTENNTKILLGAQNVGQNDNTRNIHPNEHSKENEKEETGGNKHAERDFLRVTEEMFQKMSKLENRNYTIRFHQLLGNQYLYDMICQSNNKNLNDKVVEIKYIGGFQLNQKWIDRSIGGLDAMMYAYKKEIRKESNLVLVIIYSNPSIDTENIRNEIYQSILDKPNLNGLRIQFVKEQDIDKFDANILCV
jgi:hypothetical protein